MNPFPIRVTATSWSSAVPVGRVTADGLAARDQPAEDPRTHSVAGAVPAAPLQSGTGLPGTMCGMIPTRPLGSCLAKLAAPFVTDRKVIPPGSVGVRVRMPQRVLADERGKRPSS